MEKTIYVVCDNHFDLIWNRGYERQFVYGGGTVRPYMDLEEDIIDRWIRIVENTGCVYSIEQSLSVKKYLERNPDMNRKLKELAQAGKIKFFGCGESTIDSNLVDGESIIRNHLYSIKWLEENLGVRPEYASARDTFGMSAQLPQIFRKLGYYVLYSFAYSGKPQKPYWKGLSGDLIYFLSMFGDLPGAAHSYSGKGYKVPVCPACLGAGCRHCDHSGLDRSHTNMPEYEKVEQDIIRFKDSTDENLVLMFTSEEVGERDDFVDVTRQLADKHGIEMKLSENMELIEKYAGTYIDRLKSGTPQPEDIDPRMDWNPACTGVYVTRIKMKQLNRELENALLSCEKLSVFAAKYGMVYPAKKLTGLWSQMAVLQFHDGITSSHSDGAYLELIALCSHIAMEAIRIYRAAMETLERNITVKPVEGFLPFVVFNPLTWEVMDALVDASFMIEGREDLDDIAPGYVEVLDADGNKMDVYEATAAKNYYGHSVIVRYRCDRLPSMGYRTYYLRVNDCIETPVTQPETTALHPRKTYFIENKFYRVDIKGQDVLGIYNKKLGEYVLGSFANDVTIEDDIGSPWETLMVPLLGSQRLSAPYTLEEILPMDYTVKAYIKKTGNSTMFIREGRYANKQKGVSNVNWKQELILYEGVARVDFKTEVDWDAQKSRIRLAFPLTFKPENDGGFYEIPYGTLWREAYEPTTGSYTCKNGDWPALNFVACHNEEKDYTVAILNKGIPSHRIRDGVIQLSVLRSPIELFCGFNIEGAADKGRHVFECSLVSGRGDVKACDIARKGREFNTEFMNCVAKAKEAELPDAYSFLANNNPGILISSIKQAEDGNGIILRAYEAYGNAASDSIVTSILNTMAADCDLLENETASADIAGLAYKPFEIKTIRIDLDTKERFYL